MTEAICQFEMTYGGVTRYKGEIFRLIGARNDDALVRVGHVRPIAPSDDIHRVVDDSGREFTDETSRRNARAKMPASDTKTTARRGPGRPKGSTNKPKVKA